MAAARNQRVIVAGGGIAGLATGLALARSGREVTILERQPAGFPRMSTGGWHLWSNAMQALRELGVEDETRARGAHLETSEFMTAAGKPLGVWPIGEIGRRVGATDVGISRVELHQVLCRAFSDIAGPAAIRYDERVAHIDEGSDGVTVGTERGTSYRGALLVGADGIRSAVRTHVAGVVEPRYAGYVQWQAVLPAADGAGRTALDAGTENVIFGRRARAIIHHVGAGQVFWAGIVYGPPQLREAPDPRACLLGALAGFPPSLLGLIERTPDEDINAHAISDVPALRRWTSGRVALVGDAAHAMTTNLSQGACLALEDAVVMADCLRAAGSSDDIEPLLRNYERRRQVRAQPVARRSWRIAGLGGWRSSAGVAVRDRLMRLTLPTVAVRDHERFVTQTP